MGHLINPVAMRIGWFSNWCDSWFSEFIYYPELLHLILKIRLYITYFSSLEDFEKGGIGFSHFEIIYDSYFLLVRIFYYDGIFINWLVEIQEFFGDITREHIALYKKVHFKFYSKLYYIIFYFFFQLFADEDDLLDNFFFEDYFDLLFKSRRLGKRITNLLSTKINKRKKGNNKLHELNLKVDDLYKFCDDQLLLQESFIECLPFFFSQFTSQRLLSQIVYINWEDNSFFVQRFVFYVYFFKNFFISVSNDVFAFSETKDFFISNTLLLSLFSLFYCRFYFAFFGTFLNYIIGILAPQFFIKSEVFLLDNDSITAQFLSMFFVKKFIQGYGLRELLNPISKELRVVAYITRGVTNAFFKKAMIASAEYVYKASLIRSFIAKFFLIYKRFFIKFFFSYSTWFNCYLLWFFIWFFKKFNYFSYAFIGLSKNFFNKKHSFIFFFNYDMGYVITNSILIFDQLFYDFFLQKDFSIYLYFLFDDLCSNFNIILNNDFKYFTDFSGFMAATFFLNRLLRYSYWKYNFNWVVNFKGLNKHNLRADKLLPSSGLLGFKIFFRGRFSRKQRASSIWFAQGNVPLNTLSATIDYGFSTIPLRNSLISVKVWLYKTDLYFRWFLKTF